MSGGNRSYIDKTELSRKKRRKRNTKRVLLYPSACIMGVRRGGRGVVKLSISRNSESCNEGDVVCPQDAFDPGLLWTSLAL